MDSRLARVGRKVSETTMDFGKSRSVPATVNSSPKFGAVFSQYTVLWSCNVEVPNFKALNTLVASWLSKFVTKDSASFAHICQL